MQPVHTYALQDKPAAVSIDAGWLQVQLADGHMIATPLDWYPGLLNATPEQRADLRLSFSGIHWPGLDQDLSVQGMLRGEKPVEPGKDR